MYREPIMLLSLAVPVLYFAAYAIMLVACVIGATHPTLRREFIWLALGALVHCAATLGSAVPQLLEFLRPNSISTDVRMRLIYATSAIGLFGTLLFVIGFILLAFRARMLPIMGR